jgi:hypothetical protein
MKGRLVLSKVASEEGAFPSVLNDLEREREVDARCCLVAESFAAKTVIGSWKCRFRCSRRLRMSYTEPFYTQLPMAMFISSDALL